MPVGHGVGCPRAHVGGVCAFSSRLNRSLGPCRAATGRITPGAGQNPQPSGRCLRNRHGRSVRISPDTRRDDEGYPGNPNSLRVQKQLCCHHLRLHPAAASVAPEPSIEVADLVTNIDIRLAVPGRDRDPFTGSTG
jgi:hypothetical protein